MIFPRYKNKHKRIKSFADPNLGKIWGTVGFFEKDGHFFCFFCGIEKKLSKQDCPWKSHYQSNPFCDFVLLLKGIPKSVTNECLVCFTNERDTVTFPCRHMVLCQECAQELKKCIVCRQEVVNYFKVFLN
jgi:hypothetical protein